MEMKKFVLKLDLQNDKDQQRRALKAASTLPGIDEISIDLNGKKLTVTGSVDPVSVVSKLRKRNWPANIISVGPAKEPETKEEPKKDEPKKEEEPKKDEPKKEEPEKGETKEEPEKGEPKKEEVKKGEEPKKMEEKKIEPEMVLGTTTLAYRQYQPYYPPPPPMNPYYHVHHSIEENPNACVIS